MITAESSTFSRLPGDHDARVLIEVTQLRGAVTLLVQHWEHRVEIAMTPAAARELAEALTAVS